MKISLLFILLLLTGCIKNSKNGKVVVYTSVDEVFSSQIIKEFEQKSGINVKVLYDTEATKSVGIQKRLLSQKKHPKADIFWNSQFLSSFILKKNDILKDNKIYNIGLRSRVFIVNTNLLQKNEYPKTLDDLINPKYKGKVAISNPLFGTCFAHFLSLYDKLGSKRFIDFLQKLKKNKVAVLSGNSTVRDSVANGKYLFGLVDSDDVIVALKKNLPIDMLFYNQNIDDGVFTISQTISIIKNSPNPKNAKKFLDYILTKETEQKLIKLGAVQYPLLDKKYELQFKHWNTQDKSNLDKLYKNYAQTIRKYL